MNPCLINFVKKQTTAFFLLFSICLPVFAEPSSVSLFTLNNGLKVLIKPDHRAPIATVMVWYRVGSSDEPGGLTGLSHALEHMMFKGTPNVPAGVFSKRIAELGGQENAFTNYDFTAYFEKISTASLKTVLTLEADRMQHLNLSEEEFAKEIKVIREERRLRTDNVPQSLAIERFMATAHLSPPYQHPIIGWMSDLMHMQLSSLRQWYERYYAPNNATLVIVGDVTPEAIRPLIETTFGAIHKQAHVQRHLQTEPPGLGIKQVTVHAKAQQPILILGYTVPSLKSSENKEEPYALEVLAGILDAGVNARLNQSIVQTQHLASTASAYYDLYTVYESQFMLLGIPTPGHTVNELKIALLEEIKKLSSVMVSDKELQRIKTQLIAQKAFQADSLFGQALELGLLETIGLGYRTGAEYPDKIQAVTKEQILKAAQHYFNHHQLTETTLTPDNIKAKL